MSKIGQLNAALTNEDLPADLEVQEIIELMHEQAQEQVEE